MDDPQNKQRYEATKTNESPKMTLKKKAAMKPLNGGNHSTAEHQKLSFRNQNKVFVESLDTQDKNINKQAQINKLQKPELNQMKHLPQDKVPQPQKKGVGQNLNQKGNQRKVFQSLDIDVDQLESIPNDEVQDQNIIHDQWMDDPEYRAIYRQKIKNQDQKDNRSNKSAEFSLPSISDRSGGYERRKPQKNKNRQRSVEQSAEVKMYLESGEFNHNNNFLDPHKPTFVRKRDRTLKVLDNESDSSELEKNFGVNYEQQLQLGDKRARMMIIGKMQAIQYEKDAQNDDFFMLIEKNALEKIDDMTGRCLTFRKSIFKLKTHIHHLANYIISSKPFDWVCLFVILCNSIQLAVEDPTDSGNTPTLLSYLDSIFLYFYTTEMVLKIIGLGFIFGKGTYLRSPWNVLDFVIVNTGLLQIFLSGTKINLSGLRAFRILRPLKTISGIEGLKVIVTALISSIQNLMEAFIVLYIGYMIFSITGLQLFMGYFKQQCVEIETGYADPSGDLCGKQLCAEGFVCGKTNVNPNFEQTNFDNIFYSFISVYQAVTLEGWTYTMKYAQKSYSSLSWAFFCPLTFIVAYFLLQLTQAVISNAFQNQHESKEGADKTVGKKKKKVLKDFDNLDEKERQELLEAQEDSRKMILKKWRRIYTVKSGLIRFIQAFKYKKKQEQLEQAKGERHKTRKNKLAIFNVLNKADTNIFQDEINKKKVYKFDSTSLNATTSYNNKSNFETRKGNENIVGLKNQRSMHIKQEDQYFTTPDKVMRMMGMVGIKQTNENKETSRTKQLQEQEQIRDIFDLNDLDLFQDIQYGQQSSDNISDISYFSLEHHTSKDVPKTRPPLEIASDSESNNDDKCPTPIKSTTTQNSNQPLKKLNTKTSSKDEIVVAAAQISKDLKSRKMARNQPMSPELFRNLHKSISITKRQPQNSNYEMKLSVLPSNDNNESQLVSNFDDTLANQKDGMGLLNQTGELNQSTHFNKTLMNDTTTNLKNENQYESQKSNVDSTKLKSQTTLLNQNSLKRYYGPNSIAMRDYLPMQENLLVYKFQVMEDIGKDRKIYLRKDKIDLVKPAQDIFEQRQVQQEKKLNDENIKESVNYLSDLAIKPWQRKAYLEVQQIIPDEDQVEILSQLYLEPSDLQDLIQQQYNKFYISNLYVTGTLSITIQNNTQDNKRSNVRKFQSQGLLNEENENLLAIELVSQYLSFQKLSRGSDQKNCLSNTDRSMAFFSQQNSEHNETNQKLSASGAANSRSFRAKTYNQKHGSSQGFKKLGGKAQTDINENQSALRKKIQLNKKASKDADLQKKMIIKKLTKDAMRSALFRLPVIKANGAHNRVFFFPDVPDSDEDDQKEENEDDKLDEFLDMPFDCEIEVLRAKKYALSQKIGRVEWSGQDVLADFDPSQAKFMKGIVSKIRVWPQDLQRYYKIFQWSVKRFVMGPVVDNTMTLCVLFNTVCLGMDRYGIDTATSNFLTLANKIFTYIFITEMTLKILGLGILKYLKDKMHYVDGTIVILSLVELCLSSETGALSAFRSVRIFRTFRVLRITRLLRTMKQMTVILNALFKSLESLMYLFMLVFLMIFIFSLVGMQIYGGQMDYTDNADGYPGVPRQNYDSFYWAFQTCFQLFTQENWQVILADTLRSPVNRGLTMIYHIAWMTVGNTILLNLLMGIMLDSLGSEEEIEIGSQVHQNRRLNFKKQGAELIEYFQVSTSQSNGEQVPFGGSKKKGKKKQVNENILDESFEFDQSNLNQEQDENIFKKQKENFEGNECELSFYLFKKKNPLRLFLYKLSNHFIFEAFIQFVILCSSVKLVVDSYSKQFPSTSPFFTLSAGADYAFTGIFALESLIKSLSLGFVMDKGTYLRESWSQLDFFIVVTSMIDACFSSINIPVIKVLRLLRTLRPLRVISHNSSMKNIIGALIHSVSGIFYVAILLFIVWIMFAILGVTLIMGKLYQCSISPYVYFTQAECLLAQGTWDNWPFNYDNVAIALVSLFDVSTMENWPDQRNAASDMSGTGTGPIRNNSLAYAYFFNAFIMIGTYIFLNLFIGVIFIKFQETQKEEVLASNLSLKQQRWLDMMLMIVNATPDQETTNIPQNKFRKMIHSFVTGLDLDHKDKKVSKSEEVKPGKKKKSKAKQQAEEHKNINKFEIFVMFIIALNMIHLCLNYENADSAYQAGLDYANYAFTLIFLIEATLKLLAFGSSYFKNMQNVFDFFIVCTNLMDIAMSFLSATTMENFKVGPQLVRVFRVLRLFRLYRLVKKFKGLNAMMDTIMISLPTLISTFALVLLVYFIFAILANFLFGDVTTGIIIDDYTNFRTFGTSMLTLIRSSTGEDWNYIMHDCGYTKYDNCVPGVTCGSSFNYLFFIIFELLQGFIMLNLFVLVITQQFDKYYMQDMNVLQLFKQDLAQFKELWTTFTLENTCIKIKDQKIMEFFAAMYEPLGMRPDDDSDDDESKHEHKREKEDKLMKNIIKHVVTMDLDSDADGYVYFNELLFKTLKRIYGEEHEKNRLVIEQELKTLKKIRQIKELMLKLQRKELRLKALTVNPFVIKMFKHISFKTWLKLYRQNREKRLNQKQIEGEVTISEAGDEQDEDEVNSENQYYYETEKDETCSEYEDEDENEINSLAQYDNISTLNKEINKLSGPEGFKTQRDNMRVKQDKLNLTQQNFQQTTNRTNDNQHTYQRKLSNKTPNRANRTKIQHLVNKGVKSTISQAVSQANSSKKRRSQGEEEDSIVKEFDSHSRKSGSNSLQKNRVYPGGIKQPPKISIESAQTPSQNN